MLYRVAEMLPDPEDGKALKSDLVDGASNVHSLLPAVDSLDSLKFFVRHPSVKGFPSPADSALSFLRKHWNTRSEEILTLAEQAIDSRSVYCQSIMNQLAGLIKSDSLFSATYERPNLFHSLIVENPSLLNSDSLLIVGQPKLSNLLTLLPDDPQLADQVIGRLINLDDRDVSEEMFERFPNIVMRRVMESLETISSTGDEASKNIWLKTVIKSVPELLSGGYIENLRSMSALAVFVESLGYKNHDVLKGGPLPWISVLINVNDNIIGKRRDKLFAFFLMMAIEKPMHGCEPIFERTFEPIHSAMARNKLAHDARSLVEECLPDLNWWSQWDMCRRLRLAVVRAYVNNKLDRDSFRRLTCDKKLADSLIELAVNTQKGRSFIKKKKRATRLVNKT